MPNPYFQYLPNFDYVSRIPGAKNINDYVQVKNIFKRFKVKSEVLNDLSYFTKYKIIDDERPDQIAYTYYDNPYYDWVVLLANNIINIETEWPLSQDSFYNYMIDKYDTESNFAEVHHYETIKVLTNSNRVLVPAGLEVPSDYSITYYDRSIPGVVTKGKITQAITNQQYEDKIQDNKRNIFLIKPQYITTILDEIEDAMRYSSESSQYVNDDLVKGENIRIYG